MNDQELAAEARRVAPQLRVLHRVVVDQYAAELMRQMADRLDVLAAWDGCGRCDRGTAPVPCPECRGPSCSVCGRCPACDGDLPDEED